jgi:hypothetical protein
MRLRLAFLAAAAANALLVYSGVAEDIDGHGQLLLLKNSPFGNKVVLRTSFFQAPSNDTTQDPRCAPVGGGQASVRVVSETTGEDFTIDLGGPNCAKWSFDGGRFRYFDTTGGTCKMVLMKFSPLKLKAICKGPQVDYALGAPQGTVRVVWSTGIPPDGPARTCVTFTHDGIVCVVTKDGSDGRTYRAKASRGAACFQADGCPASANGAFLESGDVF